MLEDSLIWGRGSALWLILSWQAPPPTSFSCPARLPGPFPAGRGFWGVALMLTSVPGTVSPHEHVCSEVKDGSVYITCWLVTEELVTATTMCLVLWLAFASSLCVYIYVCMFVKRHRWMESLSLPASLPCGFRHGTGFLLLEWQLFRSDNWCTVSLKG